MQLDGAGEQDFFRLAAIRVRLPSPSAGFAPVREAGGVLGYLVATPLESLVTAWVTVPLLVLFVLLDLASIDEPQIEATTMRGAP